MGDTKTRRHDARSTYLVVAAIAVAGAALAIVVLWIVLRRVLAVDQGLDMTDESLYLLAADPPSLQASFLYPWGWHTGPLFRLVGYDIASFRALGALLLLLCGAWFGWAAMRLAGSLPRVMVGFGAGAPPLEDGMPSASLTRIAAAGIGAAVGGVGTLVFYQGFLRSPGYNWLNLVGILVAGAGSMILASELGRRSIGGSGARRVWWRIGVALAIGAAGLILTIPAKPSTAIALLIIGAALVVPYAGWRTALLVTIAECVLAVAWVVLAVVAGIWPGDFVEVLLVAARAPGGADHTALGAIRNLLASPGALISPVLHPPLWAVPFLVLAACCYGLAFSDVVRRGRSARRDEDAITAGAADEVRGQDSPDVSARTRGLARAGFVLLAIGAVGIAHLPLPPIPGLPGLSRILGIGATPRISFAYAPISAGSLTMVAGALLLFLAVTAGSGARRQRRRLYALVSYLLALPVIFAFGTTNGTFPQASLAAGVFCVGALVLLAAARPDRWGRPDDAPASGVEEGDVERRPRATRRTRIDVARWVPWLVVVLFTVAIATATVRDGRLSPYRTDPIDSQTADTKLGAHGARLRLEPTQSALMTQLIEAARGAGFKVGTPLLGVNWPWSSGVSFALGAQVPGSLMLTVFGGPENQQAVDYNLANRFTGFPSADAWISTTATSDLDASARAEVADSLRAFDRVSGRTFPNGYTCVAAVGDVRLWRPVTVQSDGATSGSGGGSTCPYEPFP